MRFRAVISAVVALSILAGAGATCFALGDDAASAEACCLKQGHHDDCADAKIAEHCCKDHEANRRDRELPSVTSKAAPAAVITTSPFDSVSAPPETLRSVVSVDALSIASLAPPGHSLPLLI